MRLIDEDILSDCVCALCGDKNCLWLKKVTGAICPELCMLLNYVKDLKRIKPKENADETD